MNLGKLTKNSKLSSIDRILGKRIRKNKKIQNKEWNIQRTLKIVQTETTTHEGQLKWYRHIWWSTSEKVHEAKEIGIKKKGNPRGGDKVGEAAKVMDRKWDGLQYLKRGKNGKHFRVWHQETSL